MKQAQINLPVADNDGESVADAHQWLKRTLIEKFGGCTVSQAYGCWVDDGVNYEDANLIYHVAMEDSADNRRLFRDIAARANRLARQICVYVVLPNGEVEFISN